MRAEPTPFEDKLWARLKGKQLGGLKFSHQITVEGGICDFICRDRRLIIEVDGDTHDMAADADRDFHLGRLGYQVLRFTNREVGSNLEGVLEVILSAASVRPTKLDTLGRRYPPPTPSLGREGA